MTEGLKATVEQLKAVSHPLRLRILSLLNAGELCVCQVAEIMQMPSSSVSEGLRELRRVGFVTERKEGRWVFVSLVPKEQASPLLSGLLEEVEQLEEVVKDRLRTKIVMAEPVKDICSRLLSASKREKLLDE